MEGDFEGLAGTKRELACGRGASYGGRDGKRLARMEGALAEVDPASALLERKAVRGLRWIVEVEFQSLRLVLRSDSDERVENALQRGR